MNFVCFKLAPVLVDFEGILQSAKDKGSFSEIQYVRHDKNGAYRVFDKDGFVVMGENKANLREGK